MTTVACGSEDRCGATDPSSPQAADLHIHLCSRIPHGESSAHLCDCGHLWLETEDPQDITLSVEERLQRTIEKLEKVNADLTDTMRDTYTTELFDLRQTIEKLKAENQQLIGREFAASLDAEETARLLDIIQREAWLEAADPEQAPYIPFTSHMETVLQLEAEVAQLKEQMAFAPAFVDRLKALGFHERFLEEYRDQKMKIRQLTEEIKKLAEEREEETEWWAEEFRELSESAPRFTSKCRLAKAGDPDFQPEEIIAAHIIETETNLHMATELISNYINRNPLIFYKHDRDMMKRILALIQK